MYCSFIRSLCSRFLALVRYARQLLSFFIFLFARIIIILFVSILPQSLHVPEYMLLVAAVKLEPESRRYLFNAQCLR